jgi:ATP-binding cassette subfamily B (MDR/TAP) protein 1
MAETAENKDLGPPGGCKNFDLKNLQFSYPLAPDNRVLNGVSMEASGVPHTLSSNTL